MFPRGDINSMRHDLCSVCCERFSRVVFFDRSRFKSDESTKSIIIGTDKKYNVSHGGIDLPGRRHP